MIKFFRQIRFSLMEQNKTTRYFKYAIGEIILVVIGILIALGINNWNNNRLDDNRNQELLAKLTNELNLNIKRAIFIDTTASSFSSRAVYTDSLIKILDKGIEKKHLKFMTEGTIFYVNTFNLNTAVYEELKNTGSLYSLGSKKLVTAIQKYYQLCERESFYNLNYSENLKTLRIRCFEGWSDFRYLYSKKGEEALKHHSWIFNPRSSNYIKFRQYVYAANGNSNLMSSKLKGIAKASEDLKELISTEIK